MSEVQLNGQTYLCTKMPARKQFHVARRLTPLINHLTPLIVQQRPQTLISDSDGNMVPVASGISLIEGLAAISDTLREIPDADADFVIDTCLDAVRFKSGNAWAPLRAPGSPSGGGLMNSAADDLATQLRLVWEVLVLNLQNFSLETLLSFPSGNGLATGATA